MVPTCRLASQQARPRARQAPHHSRSCQPQGSQARLPPPGVTTPTGTRTKLGARKTARGARQPAQHTYLQQIGYGEDVGVLIGPTFAPPDPVLLHEGRVVVPKAARAHWGRSLRRSDQHLLCRGRGNPSSLEKTPAASAMSPACRLRPAHAVQHDFPAPWTCLGGGQRCANELGEPLPLQHGHAATQNVQLTANNGAFPAAPLEGVQDPKGSVASGQSASRPGAGPGRQSAMHC